MDQARSACVLAQALRADAGGLSSLASAMKDTGQHGVNCPSLKTDNDGLSAGAAVLVPSMITGMSPPGLDSPISWAMCRCEGGLGMR
eukprot:9234303-Pyramimonas_sp.AAC.1